MKTSNHTGIGIHTGSPILLSVLALICLAVSPIRAQNACSANTCSASPWLSPPVPESVFPLGGLMFSLTPDSTCWNKYLPVFGLNVVNKGGGQCTTAGLTNGITGYAMDQGGLDHFFPSGEGYNPMFTQLDFNLASNENPTGITPPPASAWDEQSDWRLKGGATDGNGEYFIHQITGNLGSPHAGYYLMGFNEPTDAPCQNCDWSAGTYQAGKVVHHVRSECTYEYWTSQKKDNTDEPGCSNSNWRPVTKLDVATQITSPSVLYVDFVYRINKPIDYPSVTGEIYNLECKAHWSDGSVTSCLKYTADGGANWPTSTETGVPINVEDFNWYVQHSPSKENSNLLKFPNPNLMPIGTNYQPHSYAILRIEVTVPAGQSLWALDVNLKGTNANGIYVRGVRVRSKTADLFFNGAYDNNNNPSGGVAIDKSLNAIFQDNYNGLGSAWPKTHTIDCANESGWQTIRSFAYINEKLHTFSKLHGGTQKNLSSIRTGGNTYAYWRSIYEDQAPGAIPPPLEAQHGINIFGQGENYGVIGSNDGGIGRPDHDFDARPPWYSGGLDWSPGSFKFGPYQDYKIRGHLYPGDAIASAVKNHVGFKELGLTITGWNGGPTYGSTNRSPSSTGDPQKDSDNYETYTSRFRDQCLVWDDRSLPWQSVAPSKYTLAATTCYPQDKDPSQWTSFYGFPSTISGDHAPECWRVIRDKMRATLYDDLTDNTLPNNFKFEVLRSMYSPSEWSQNKTYSKDEWVIRTGMGCDDVCWLSKSDNNYGNVPVCGANTGKWHFFTSLKPSPGDWVNKNWVSGMHCSIGDWVKHQTGSSDCAYQYWVCYAENTGVEPTCSQAKYWHPAPTSFDEFFGYMERPPTQWEIRQQTWEALAWGAKGIFFNTIGNDGGENRGFGGTNLDANYNSGFSDVTDGSDSYKEYGYFYLPFDFAIPFATAAKHDPATTFPDRWVVADGLNQWGQPAWIHKYVPSYTSHPILDHGGNVVFPSNTQLNADNLNAYILAVQSYGDPGTGSSSDPNMLHYYQDELGNALSNFYPAVFSPDANGKPIQANNSSLPGSVNVGPGGAFPPECSNWPAFDRRLDNDADAGFDMGQKFPSANFHQYDGAWNGLLTYPSWFASCFVTGVPTYYGVKDKNDGVKRAVADIVPIAAQLKKLRWSTTINYEDLQAASGSALRKWANANNGKTPLSITNSFKVDRSNMSSGQHVVTTDVDEASKQYYNMGVFKDPDDPDAYYVIITNKRTWPVHYKEDGSIQPTDPPTDAQTVYLGAIDVRQVELHLKDSWMDGAQTVNWASKGYSHYVIDNFRPSTIPNDPNHPVAPFGKATYVDQISNPSSYSLVLEPGEGTLLRVAPATSVPFGRTTFSGMAWNNGHRVASLPNNYRAVTWQTLDPTSGQYVIQFGITDAPVPDGQDPQSFANLPMTVYTLAYQSDNSKHQLGDGFGSSVDASNNSVILGRLNPSIAAKGGVSKDTLAIIFNLENDPNPQSLGDRQVIVDWVVIPHGGSPTVHPLSVATVKGSELQPFDHLVTPVVTACQDGFFCAWSDFHDGIHSAISYCPLPPGTHPIIAPSTFNAVTSGEPLLPRRMSVFPTVAAQNEPFAPALPERFNLAFEEDFWDGTSHIYYKYFEKPIGSWSVDASAPVERVSKGAPSCHHHHPNIALNPATTWFDNTLHNAHGQPLVTWEMNMPDAGCPDGLDFQPAGAVYSMLRQRIDWGSPYWGDMTAILPKVNNLPQPLVQHNAFELGNSPLNRQVILQDSFANIIHLFDLQHTDPALHYQFNEYGRNPSLMLPVDNPVAQVAYYSFRGMTPDQNGLYEAKILAHYSQDMHLVTTPHIPVIHAGKNALPCESPLTYSIQHGSRVCYSTSDPTHATYDTCNQSIEWLSNSLVNPLRVDSLSGQQNLDWPRTEDTIRTTCFTASAGDTIQMNDILTLPDSATMIDMLPDSTHFIDIALMLKDSATHQTVSTLNEIHILGGSIPGGPLVGPIMYPYPYWYCFEVIASGPITHSTMVHVHQIPLAVAPPSGSGYLTLSVTKDALTSTSLWMTHVYADDYILPDTSGSSGGDSTAYKKSQPHPKTTTASIGAMNITLHPNPTSSHLLICVDAIPADNPFMAEVVSATGQHVATLYDATPEADLGLCYTLDCSQLVNGSYYVRVANSILGGVVKFQVVR